MSFSGWMLKQIVIKSYDRILPSNRKEQIINIRKNWNELQGNDAEGKILKSRSPKIK